MALPADQEAQLQAFVTSPQFLALAPGRDRMNAWLAFMNQLTGAHAPQFGATGGFFQPIPGQPVGETTATRIAGGAAGAVMAPALLAGAPAAAAPGVNAAAGSTVAQQLLRAMPSVVGTLATSGALGGGGTAGSGNSGLPAGLSDQLTHLISNQAAMSDAALPVYRAATTLAQKLLPDTAFTGGIGPSGAPLPFPMRPAAGSPGTSPVNFGDLSRQAQSFFGGL